MDYRSEQIKCRELRAEGFSRSEIAEKLNLSFRQVKERLTGELRPEVSREKPAVSSDSLFDKDGIVDRSLFSYKEYGQKRESVSKLIEDKYGGDELDILILNDIHVPFTDYNALSRAIDSGSDADVVVVNGDLLDLFAVSKFSKDKNVALSREVREAREVLETLSNKFEDVVVTEGNHERRLARFIQDTIPEDIQFLFPTDILQMVADGKFNGQGSLKNVHVVGSWWVKLFDTIFAHPDNYSSVPMRTAQMTSEYFTVVERVPHRQCIVGHTHRAGWVPSGDVNLMETGCLCFDMDYHKGAKFVKTKWTKAHGKIHIDKNGMSDFNRSKVILL